MKISYGAKAFVRDASESTVGNLSSNTQHCTPLECRREEESCSIDIAQDPLSRSLFSRLILWSENQTTKEHFSRLVIERKTSVTFRMNYYDMDNGALSSDTISNPFLEKEICTTIW